MCGYHGDPNLPSSLTSRPLRFASRLRIALMLNRSQSMTTMVLLSLFPIFSMGLVSSIAQTIPAKPKPSDSHVAQPAAAATDWRETEKDTLAHQTQITFGDRFLKAGESY